MLLIILLSLGVNVQANDQAAQSAANGEIVVQESELERDLICRMEKPIGSHIARRRCYTPMQLRIMSESARLFLNNMSLETRPNTGRSPAAGRQR